MWNDFISDKFSKKEGYAIDRRGYWVNLRYLLSKQSATGKTADVFYGRNMRGDDGFGNLLFFAFMNDRYACSTCLEKSVQKLWSGKTNKLKAIYQQEYGARIKV